jgi:glycosyl transferase family 87
VALAAGLLLLAVSSCAIAFSLRLRSLTSTVVAVYLVAFAEVVGLTELLSLGHAIGEKGYLLGQLAFAGVALLVWSRTQALPPAPRFPRGIRRHPLVAVLLVVVTGAVAYQAFVGLGTPPTNWDSLTYHLPRAAQWVQNGALGYVDAAPTQRINMFPPNAEIAIAYTFALAHGDWLAGGPQLVAELVLLLTIFGTARRLGFTRSSAAFAALLFATFSNIALESVTAQNDLVVASFVAAAAMYIIGREPREQALAGLAIGLAVGTKLTAVFALLPLAVLGVIIWRRRIFPLAAWSVAACAAFGAYAYVANLEHTGNPFGSHHERFQTDPSIGGVTSTSLRVFYRFLDLPGFASAYLVVAVGLVAVLVTAMIVQGSRRAASWEGRDALLFAVPVLAPIWIPIVALVARHVFSLIHVPVNAAGSTATRFRYGVNGMADEDLAYFGPLGAALLLPFAAVPLVNWFRGRRDAVQVLLGATLFLFVLELAAVYKYNAWIGRFVTLPCALCAPLLALAYKRRALAAGAVTVAVISLALAHAFNVNKPAGFEGAAIWSLPRSATVSISSFVGPDMANSIVTALRGDQRVGAVMGPEDPSYMLYGPDLRRRVVYLRRRGTFAEAERRGVTTIVFGDVPKPPSRLAAAKRWQFAPLGHWMVATKALAPTGTATASADLKAVDRGGRPQ